MKSNSFHFWYACTLPVASLLAGVCCGEPQQTPAPREPVAVVEPRVVSGPRVVRAIPDDGSARVLSWDAVQRRRVIKDGEGPVRFSFRMKNVSQETVVIEKVSVSCGCTSFDTRAMPFTLAPGAFENIKISMHVTGNIGTVTKSILVQGSRANWTLLVTTEVLPRADEVAGLGLSSGAGMPATARSRNIRLAQTDRQAVFRGDCASCHSRFAEGQFGYNLYLGACAICHDAAHRASMVPDLRAAAVLRDATDWRQHIDDGLDGTLMPAFAKAKGGILSDEQIESLIKFLTESPLEP
ncbi:MAG: DUF1573 domain-containing protein [Planctomycetaceae bacterium]|nr:DUF1573 domain-containing protein [Planctomycetales bacterium]MCB9922417.1 DUF1573 domain-containing protein [Planctomycetaceae bacterium]